MIGYYQRMFARAALPLWLRPYRILSLSRDSGLIELVHDATSIDRLKKGERYPGTLRGHFERTYGPVGTRGFAVARRKFLNSLAGYAVVCYLLGIKDRHNGNVLLDKEGHLVQARASARASAPVHARVARVTSTSVCAARPRVLAGRVEGARARVTLGLAARPGRTSRSTERRRRCPRSSDAQAIFFCRSYVRRAPPGF